MISQERNQKNPVYEKKLCRTNDTVSTNCKGEKEKGTYRIKDTQDINQLQPMDGSYSGDN